MAGLAEDLGVSTETPKTQDLAGDLGISTPSDNKQTSAYPVSDELSQIGSNILKQLPRHVMQGLGKLADLPGDIWDLAFHPEGAEPMDLGYEVGKAASSTLEKKVPSLKPTNEGPLERSVGAGIEAAPTGLLAGPEAVIPTAVSGGMSQAVKEAGGGPVAQFAAGMLPLSPATASGALRTAARGGAEGAAQLEQNLQNAQKAGLNLSAGQLTNNPTLRAAETAGSKIPFGHSLAETRGSGLNQQVEQSVSGIVDRLTPKAKGEAPTVTTLGQTVKPQAAKTIAASNVETNAARTAMEDAVGGKDTPWSLPKTEAAARQVSGPTGIEEVDNLVTGSKTKAVAKIVNAVSQEPQIPTSYVTDGEGYHQANSPNGQTHAVETANGDVKVTRSDTAPGAQGNGEGTARLETLARAAAQSGKNLTSDISVSPAEAAAYEKLGRKGWNVQKNPNAEVNPATGNLISDSPKNPVYTVSAPKSVSGTPTNKPTTEQGFTGEWTYDPKTGKTEPVTEAKPDTQQQTAEIGLNSPTPWTFDSARSLRTSIGQAISTVRNPTQKAQLKQLYKSISQDMEDGVKAKGQDAEQAYTFFNSVAKQNAKTQQALTKYVGDNGGLPQLIDQTINSGRIGAGRISPIMSMLDTEGKNAFRATVLHRLGRSGGAADAPFDANTYLSNWKKLAPETKNVLFGKGGTGATGQLRQSLDSLSDTLDLLQKQGYIKSGFVKGVEKGTAGLKHFGIAGLVGLLAEHASGVIGHVVEGHPFTAVTAGVTGAGALALNPVMSRVLTNPKTAAWLAQATKAPKSAMPILINQLKNMNDPDGNDLYNLLAQEQK